MAKKRKMTNETIDKINEMLEAGYTKKSISEELGINQRTIRQYKDKMPFYDNIHRETDFINKFNEKYGDSFIYVGGYVNSDRCIKIMCKERNHVFEKNAQIIRKSNQKSLYCYECTKEREKEDSIKKSLLKPLKDEIKELMNQQRIINNAIQEMKRKLDSLHKCEECCSYFFLNRRRVYCSDKCMKRATARKKDINRRIKIKSTSNYDKNISLAHLIERDDNICHLCGCECDITDYETNDQGHFIAGKTYPSIDHIVAIVNGGTHTWDNVSLAHHYCNSKKNSSVIDFETEGQLKFFL